MKRLLILISVIALLLAACGGGDDDTGAIPVNTGGDTPAASGACLEGEPDCQDTGVDIEPQDLPSDDNDTVGGMVVDGGLTISDALAGDVTGVIAVQGFVVSDANGIRLCDALAESYPPQCGGASLMLDSLDAIDPDELSSEGDVSWTDQPVTVFGELVDETLATTTLSQ